MTTEIDDAAAAAAEDAAFASGFPDKPPEKGKPDAKPADKPADKSDTTPAKVEAKVAAPAAAVVEKPEYVKITRKDWESLQARTASHEGQFSKAFGTIGNLQKLVNGFQERTPAGRKVEIPKEAFAAMERDFPELAQQTRGALEAALSGLTGTGGSAAEVDDARLEAFASAREAKRELKLLTEEHPDWQKIVGAVDITKTQPDPNNLFRKWLATKDKAYQDRLNAADSAVVISRAIDLFQAETKAAKPVVPANPRDTARVARIASAVQPRGDNAGAPAGPSDDEQFEAGFNSR